MVDRLSVVSCPRITGYSEVIRFDEKRPLMRMKELVAGLYFRQGYGYSQQGYGLSHLKRAAPGMTQSTEANGGFLSCRNRSLHSM